MWLPYSFCDPMDCSWPGSSVHGITQARILEWDHFESVYWICYNIASVLYIYIFDQEACGILASQPGMEPTPPALEGKLLTTGLPGKSLSWHNLY